MVRSRRGNTAEDSNLADIPGTAMAAAMLVPCILLIAAIQVVSWSMDLGRSLGR